jgi:hypothetical protein
MLLLQSRHIVLFEIAVRLFLLGGIRLGVACRDRVRNPRIASDDVIFVVRAIGEVQESQKLCIAVQCVAQYKRTALKGYQAQET